MAKLKFSNSMATICKMNPRTIRDWGREKYHMSCIALERLCEAADIPPPKSIKILPEHWNVKNAGRIGALRRYELYGNPGTPKGRSKGARATLRKFRIDPAYAKRVGFSIRKEIKRPRKMPLLAEFIGIVLGDGNIEKYQVKISVNSKTDRPYAYFIRRIVKKLFGISSSINLEKKNTLGVVISSKSLVDFLASCGTYRGDKVIRQAGVPSWILKRKELIRGCLRGLIDTDGCIYFQVHTTKGIKYRHMGLGFTNLSLPLLNSVYHMFLALGITAKTDRKSHVAVYDRNEINKYMKEVGSHNRKHVKRFKSYKGSKIFV